MERGNPKAIAGCENPEASNTKARILEIPGLSKRVVSGRGKKALSDAESWTGIWAPPGQFLVLGVQIFNAQETFVFYW